MRQWSEASRWNELRLEGEGRTGVIVSGIAANYFFENFGPGEALPPYLRIGTYPLPVGLIEKLMDHVDEVLVIEEGYPFIESALRGLLDRPRGKMIHGRFDGRVPRVGELDPDVVRASLGKGPLARQEPSRLPLAGRPPCLCDGCPHIDSFNLIQVILKEQPAARVFSDIGCYTLATYPPYQACHSCVCMGASISMAMGAAAQGMRPVIASIGDSTFVHSGMTPLVGAAKQNLAMTVFILDNATVGMTGGQETMSSGDALVSIVKGLGVNPEHVHAIRAHRKDHEKNLELVRREIAYPGLSVIIPSRECVQTVKK